MKTIFLVFTSLLLAGCSIIGTHSIQQVFRGVDDYTVTAKGLSNALSIDKYFPERASLLVEFGADSCAVAEYARGHESYSVEVVSFFSAKSALGYFTLFDMKESDSVDLGYAGSKNDISVQFAKGNYYIRILPQKGTEINGALNLAKRLAKRIPGATIRPDLYENLPKDKLVKGSEFYFKGIHAFQMRFPEDLADILSIGGAIEGVAGKYLTDTVNTVNVLKVHYTGRSQTVEALQSYLTSREGSRIIPSRQQMNYSTIINPDATETYIAEYGEWLLMFLNAPKGRSALSMFEYMLRSIQ
ncbi:MAG: DUF6599 family protein [Candidatus Latescibacterota bacterium]